MEASIVSLSAEVFNFATLCLARNAPRAKDINSSQRAEQMPVKVIVIRKLKARNIVELGVAIGICLFAAFKAKKNAKAGAKKDARGQPPHSESAAAKSQPPHTQTAAAQGQMPPPRYTEARSSLPTGNANIGHGGPTLLSLEQEQAEFKAERRAENRKVDKLMDATYEKCSAGHFGSAIEMCTSMLAEGLLRPNAASLYLERAMAHGGAGNVADAIADCIRARALDPKFDKAYVEEAQFLQEVYCPLEADEVLRSRLRRASSSEIAKMEDVRACLKDVKWDLQFDMQPDHYRLLGVKRKCSMEEVRKAYRRQALKFHPDKAIANVKYRIAFQEYDSQAEVTDEIEALEERLKQGASRLFGLIQEACNALSDAKQRYSVDEFLYWACRGIFNPRLY